MAKGNNSTTSTASISDLPELPLLTIFDYVPLRNLLHIDEVCRAWQELKPEACSRRRQLIIANDQKDLVTLQPSCIESILLPPLDGEGARSLYLKPKVSFDHNVLFLGRNQQLQTTLDRLFELLPNLKVFRLARQHGSSKELSKVNQLLAHYRRQLAEVTIWFWGGLIDDDRNRAEAQLAFQQEFLSLMANLNRLTALRSLHVNFQSPPNCPVTLDDRQLATHCLPDVAGRLTCLKFRTRLEFSNSRNNFDIDACLLKQILSRMRDGGGADKAVAGEGSKLKQQQPKKQENLELYLSGTPLTLKTVVLLGPVAAGLRTVEIGGVFSANLEAEYKALARLARQSPHLQGLTVNVKSLSIHRLVESLTSLQELAYLHICCLPVPNAPPEAVNIDQLPVLPSVKLLELDFLSDSHRDYEQLHLEVLLPNLTTVLWNYMDVSCRDCGYLIPPEEITLYQRDPDYLRRNARQFKAKYGQQMQKCLRLARLTAFSRLPQLASLWVKVCPTGYVELPFRNEAFANHASLFRQTEFLSWENSPPYVVYND